MSDIKTTIVGIILLLIAVSSIVFVYVGKATLTEAGAFISLIVTILTGIGFLFSKDTKK